MIEALFCNHTLIATPQAISGIELTLQPSISCASDITVRIPLMYPKFSKESNQHPPNIHPLLPAILTRSSPLLARRAPVSPRRDAEPLCGAPGDIFGVGGHDDPAPALAPPRPEAEGPRRRRGARPSCSCGRRIRRRAPGSRGRKTAFLRKSG